MFFKDKLPKAKQKILIHDKEGKKQLCIFCKNSQGKFIFLSAENDLISVVCPECEGEDCFSIESRWFKTK